MENIQELTCFKSECKYTKFLKSPIVLFVFNSLYTLPDLHNKEYITKNDFFLVVLTITKPYRAFFDAFYLFDYQLFN